MQAFQIINGVGVIGGKPVERGETWDRGPALPGQGVRIKCANGYIVSVAWGPYHYGTGVDEAEVGIISPTTGHLIHREEWNDEVTGWRTPQEVWDLYAEVSGWE
jgi:hypothetical protein